MLNTDLQCLQRSKIDSPSYLNHHIVLPRKTYVISSSDKNNFTWNEISVMAHNESVFILRLLYKVNIGCNSIYYNINIIHLHEQFFYANTFAIFVFQILLYISLHDLQYKYTLSNTSSDLRILSRRNIMKWQRFSDSLTRNIICKYFQWEIAQNWLG